MLSISGISNIEVTYGRLCFWLSSDGLWTPISDTGTEASTKSNSHITYTLIRYSIYENGKTISIPDKPYLLEDKDFGVDISIVVPAYNEEARLPTMMTDTLKVSDCFIALNST
jgi:hypothetical protein